jgi:hypothetical protein
MKHWVDELSDREENLDRNPKAGIGTIAFRRVHKCVEECRKIYNDRHPDKTIPPPTVNEDGVLSIRFGEPKKQFGFQFRPGNPEFTRYLVIDDQQVEEKGELCVDSSGALWLSFHGIRTPLASVVRGTIQRYFFPNVPFNEAETGTQYYW